MSRGLTRRSLLRRGGVAGGATLLGASGLALGGPAAAAAQGDRKRPNALLIVSSGHRADSLGAYEGAFDDETRNDIDSVTVETPNLNSLADDSIRFERAIADATPGMVARRALVSGRRSFPYRDWRRTEGLAAVPGFAPFLPRNPTLPEWLAARSDVTPVWITDNPLFETGKLFGEVVRTRRRVRADFEDHPAIEAPLDAAQARKDIRATLLPMIERRTAAFKRAADEGIQRLDALRGDAPFFLAVDGFDQAEAYYPPRAYVRELFSESQLTIDRWKDWLVQADFDDAVANEVRAAYEDSLRSVDGDVGRLLDKLSDAGLDEDTIVYYLSDGTTMLGEYGALGPGAPGAFQPGYWVPYLIRDPARRKAGNAIEFHASTHDVAPTICSMMGLTQPGKWQGNDLSAEFDGDDILLDRPIFVSANMTTIFVMKDNFTMVSDWYGAERALYDDREEGEDDIEYPANLTVVVKHPKLVEEMWALVMGTAGGDMPDFGPDGPLRPAKEDDDADDDGIDDDDENNEGDTEGIRDLDDTDQDFDRNDGRGQTVPPDPGPTGDNVQPLPQSTPQN